MATDRDTSPSSQPLVSVSVVSHGDSAPLALLLDSLARCEAASRLQLIITDNLGNELPALDPSPWSSLTLLRNARPAGYARNHNAAFEHAQGEYFCVANPDVRLIQPVFGALIQSLETGAGAITAPLVVDSKGVVQDSFRLLPTPLELVQRRLRRWTAAPALSPDLAVAPTDWLAGIFMFLRRKTFAGLHGFDARYRLYFEDVDFCTRARLIGLNSIVNTRVRVQHDARRASRRPGQYLLWHLQSSLRFFTSSVYWRAQVAGRQTEATL